ncbi:MAG: hypothetical protein PHS14_10550 [Elusimicrobia bacterium]|nr:hypothetical protein [Elusimicrobiota bacterium]
MPPVSTAEMLAIFKVWYTDDKMEQLLFPNSSVVRSIDKVRVGGSSYNFPMMSGRGGAVSGNGATAVALSATTARNAQMAAEHGQVFSAFQLTQKEMLASRNTRGAFEPAGVVKMFAATDGLRKGFGKSFYGMGFGELGTVQAIVLAGAATMLVDSSTVLGLDVGSQVDITDGSIGLPSDPIIAGGPFTVSQVDGPDAAGLYTVTFAPVAPAGGFAAGAWIVLHDCRDAGGLPLFPMGLGGALPWWFNRTGASWLAYIAALFQTVNRSTFVNRLAGGFVLRDIPGLESYHHAVTRAVRLARFQGGVNDLIVLNDSDYAIIIGELEADRNYWQAINTGDKKSGNEVVIGLEQMSYQFATSWVKNVVPDPFCPNGTFYVLEKRVLKFVALSNPEKAANDGLSGNEPGAPPITESGDTPTDRYALNIDDILTLNPAAVGQDGAGMQGLLSIFGAWVVQNPAHCVVGRFV